MPGTYDVIVIGAGAVGENVAGRVVRGGLSCLLVEHELVGGECSYWACMPSKALIRPTQAVHAARRVAGAAAAVTGEVDVRAVLERRTTFTHDWDDTSQVEWAEGAGIELLRGYARVTGERRVVVEGTTGARQDLEARHAVVVCTGSVPVVPPVPGLRESEPWTSRDATSAREVPESLVVIGAGVVGAEMSQAYRRLGARVSLVGGALLERAEPFAGDLVADALREDGVALHLDVRAERVETLDGGRGSRVHLTDGTALEGKRLLVATGRRPRTDDLGLEPFGVEPGEPLAVDASGRVPGVPWLYGAGDVTGRAPLTHQGKYEARATGDAIAARAAGELGDDEPARFSRFAASADDGMVPQVVFTDPEVAWVGLTADEARERYGESRIRVVDHDMAQIAGASVYDDSYRGRARMVVDEERRVVVGVTFVGPDVAELLHSATVAVVGEVPLDRLWHAVPSYPTTSEVWLRLLEEYGL